MKHCLDSIKSIRLPAASKAAPGAAAGYFLKGIAHTTLTGTGLPSIFPGVQSGILLKILMAS